MRFYNDTYVWSYSAVDRETGATMRYRTAVKADCFKLTREGTNTLKLYVDKLHRTFATTTTAALWACFLPEELAAKIVKARVNLSGLI